MNLQQMIASVDSKSSFSRPIEEIFEAINSGARRLYNWILKEQSGYFFKWDTSLTLIPNTAEYQLQPDIEQIVRVRVQNPQSGVWQIVHSADFNDIARVQNIFGSFFDFDDLGSATDSPFRFYGPYQKAGADNYYIQFQGNADQNYPIEIVYTAQFVEIESPNDYFGIPVEARDAVKDYAISECCKPNSDELWEVYEASGDKKRNEYLVILRSRQVQDTPKLESYIDP